MSEKAQVLIGSHGGWCAASVWASSRSIDWSTEVRQQICIWYASLLHSLDQPSRETCYCSSSGGSTNSETMTGIEVMVITSILEQGNSQKRGDLCTVEATSTLCPESNLHASCAIFWQTNSSLSPGKMLTGV